MARADKAEALALPEVDASSQQDEPDEPDLQAQLKDIG